MNTPLPTPERYAIKSRYVHRSAPEYYSDNPERHEAGVIWQPEVYETAARLAKAADCDTLVDIGCGSASKLAPLHPEFHIIGIDYGSNLEYCRNTYPQGEWIEANLETIEAMPLDDTRLRGAVVICSDVIEHLIDPMPLLRILREMVKSCHCGLISTPERNLSWGQGHEGPPPNPHHIREWALPELRELICSAGMEPVYCGLTLTQNQSDARSTILIVVKGTGGEIDQDLLPPPVPNRLYRWRVMRRTFGVWLESIKNRCYAKLRRGGT
jgi:SAM-dependent methyltransferase